MQTEHIERSSLFRNFLKREFLQRMRTNPSYSLRAYARNLGASPSYVSQILNSSKQVSFERMEKFIAQLGYSPNKLQELLSSDEYVRHEQLNKDIHEVTSIWYYHAILELTHLENFQGEPAWIANKLGLSINEVKLALETLLRLNLLKIEDGKWIDCYEYSTINFDGNTTSTALKKYQTDLLQLSQQAVEKTSPEDRQHRSLIYAVDQSLIPEFHKKIREFLLKSTQSLENKSANKDSVFALQISSFPIFKESKNDQ